MANGMARVALPAARFAGGTEPSPEVREYMALGIKDDEEIGQPSEIKKVVYAG